MVPSVQEAFVVWWRVPGDRNLMWLITVGSIW